MNRQWEHFPGRANPPRSLDGRRVLVMGLGSFGGGEGVVRFLSQEGARVTLTDLKSEADLGATLDRLRDCRIEAMHLGGHREDDFRYADTIVVNPAVPPTHPLLALARSEGAVLTSEMRLFAEYNRGTVLAVTGTVGKSTTTSLLERMLTAAGHKTWLGGNIGHSLLPDVWKIQHDDLVILELSSFQLADLHESDYFNPQVVVVTNFWPNHLDWHGTVDHYRWAKQAILRSQLTDGLAVLNADDPDVRTWPTSGAVAWFAGRPIEFCPLSFPEQPGLLLFEIPFATREASAEELNWRNRSINCFVDGCMLVTQQFSIDLRTEFPLPGRHHAMNAAAATSAALGMGADEAAIRAALRSFTGLPHRLQLLGTFHGRRFFDDSKATTPEAAIAALESFEEPVVLLAGGYDKHVDLGPFAEVIARRVKAVVLMGQTAAELERRLSELINDGGVSRFSRDGVEVAPSFDEACEWAFRRSSPGDAVLLSPGCASYGLFNNYVERGQAFAVAVSGWAAGD